MLINETEVMTHCLGKLFYKTKLDVVKENTQKYLFMGNKNKEVTLCKSSVFLTGSLL